LVVVEVEIRRWERTLVRDTRTEREHRTTPPSRRIQRRATTPSWAASTARLVADSVPDLTALSRALPPRITTRVSNSWFFSAHLAA
jgi:hypothetical protein